MKQHSSQDLQTQVKATKFITSPWPNGPDKSLGLFVIVAVQVGTPNTEVAVDAVDDLSPGDRAEVVRSLQALIRQYESA